MNALKHGLLAVLALTVFAAPASGAQNIGVTAGITNSVSGTLATDKRALTSGARVFQDEVIATEKESAAQLLFNDQTSLTVGPESSVTLDRFVYDPDRNAGKVVLNFTKGAVRFITGSMDPLSYEIRTPVATVGVRGTILDIFFSAGILTVICVEGQGVIGDLILNPGKMAVFGPNGLMLGPVDADQTGRRRVGFISFPLHVVQWDPTLDKQYLEDVLDGLDIEPAAGDTPPPPPPPPPQIDLN